MKRLVLPGEPLHPALRIWPRLQTKGTLPKVHACHTAPVEQWWKGLMAPSQVLPQHNSLIDVESLCNTSTPINSYNPSQGRNQIGIRNQRPGCPNAARRKLWPRKWFLLGRDNDARHVHRCRWISTRVWSHQLTSDLRDVYFFGYACNGQVGQQFRCLRLSQEACGAPQRLAVLVIRENHRHRLW